MSIEVELPASELPTNEMAILLRFLGRLWLRELDGPTRSALLGDLSDSWQSMGGALPEDSLEDLQSDFCQLFSHPKSYVAPFQSVWTKGQLEGPAAQSMRRYLTESGYAEQTDQIGLDEVPDHLGVQLDLAGWMLSQSADEEGLVVAVAQRFMREHLQWAGQLLQRAEVAAGTEFYRSLIRVTRNLLASD